MKTIKIFLLQFIYLTCIVSQNVYMPPTFNFSGTKVSWNKRVAEISNSLDGEIIYDKDQLYQRLSHVIFNNKIYYLLDNTGFKEQIGSTLACYDLTTGDSLWQKNFNTWNYNAGYNYNWDFRIQNPYLELFGEASIQEGSGNFPKGYVSRRVIDELGNDIELYTNKDFHDRVSFQQSIPPIYLEGQDFAFFYRSGISKDSNYNYAIWPYIWNENLQSRILPEYAVKFYEPTSYDPVLRGPVAINSLKYYYFVQFYNYTLKEYTHYMWHTNGSGKFFDLTNVSSILGGINKQDAIQGYQKSGTLIRLKTFTKLKDYKQGNAGYIYLDSNGKLVKDQRAMVFDGKHVGHIVTNDFDLLKEKLHVIRFVEENNIYFYLEDSLGNFKKTGELINQGDSKFAFIPLFVKSSSRNDIVLSFYVALDSIFAGQNFVLGGWAYICKINAEDLKIKTQNIDLEKLQTQLRPNPCNQEIFIDINENLTKGFLNVYDINHKVYESAILKNKCTYLINTINFPSGVYFIEIYDELRNKYCVEKFIKL